MAAIKYLYFHFIRPLDEIEEVSLSGKNPDERGSFNSGNPHCLPIKQHCAYPRGEKGCGSPSDWDQGEVGLSRRV
jgi:hypothetical protein